MLCLPSVDDVAIDADDVKNALRDTTTISFTAISFTAIFTASRVKI